MQIARQSEEPLSVSLASRALQALLTVGSDDTEFWKALVAEENFSTTFRDMILVDGRAPLRHAVEKLVISFLDSEGNSGMFPAMSDVNEALDREGPFRIVKHFLTITYELLPMTFNQSKSCLEFFRLGQVLLQKALAQSSQAFDFQELALKLSHLLLEAESTEVRRNPRLLFCITRESSLKML